MMNEKNIARYALEYALSRGCRQAKALLCMGQENELEVRDRKIDRLHYSSGCQLSLALFVDGSYSSISTNRLDKNELERFIDNGIISTRYLAPDPYRCLPDKDLYYRGQMNDFGLHDDDYSHVSIDDKLKAVNDAFDELQDDRLISSSIAVNDDETINYMIDSNGFEGESCRSDFGFCAQVCVSGNGDEHPEDYCYAEASHWHDLKRSGVANEALRRSVSKIGADRINSGKYAVVVDRWVASTLLRPLIAAMKGEALHQRASFLLDKLGTKIVSDKLTIIDDPLQMRKVGAALYDVDGVALKRMPLIEGGVLKNYYISQYMGRKMSAAATTGSTSVLDFHCGELDTPSLVRQMHNGILITGFNGGNCNGTTGDFSYGIEGFVVENGVISKPINEMLMTGNMLSLWNSLEDLSNDPLPYSAWNVPSLLFDGVTLN